MKLARERGVDRLELPSPSDCLPVKWHTRQKHRLLETYFGIWAENVGKARGKAANPSLTVVDLFASRGWCYCEDVVRTHPTEAVWPGTAVLAARLLTAYETRWGRRLVLNSYTPESEDAQREQLRLLRAAVLRENPQLDVAYIAKPAVEAVADALQLVNPRYPSVWILDPFHLEHLPWSVVDAVIRHTGAYETKGGESEVRRPEVFISLMTHDLQRNLLKEEGGTRRSFSIALGMAEEEWMPRYKALLESGWNQRDAAIALYAQKLEAVYGRVPIVTLIKAPEGAVVYAIFFCSTHDAGHYMMMLRGLPEFEAWNETVWKRGARGKLALAKEERDAAKSGTKATQLSDFFGGR